MDMQISPPPHFTALINCICIEQDLVPYFSLQDFRQRLRGIVCPSVTQDNWKLQVMSLSQNQKWHFIVNLLNLSFQLLRGCSVLVILPDFIVMSSCATQHIVLNMIIRTVLLAYYIDSLQKRVIHGSGDFCCHLNYFYPRIVRRLPGLLVCIGEQLKY